MFTNIMHTLIISVEIIYSPLIKLTWAKNRKKKTYCLFILFCVSLFLLHLCLWLLLIPPWLTIVPCRSLLLLRVLYFGSRWGGGCGRCVGSSGCCGSQCTTARGFNLEARRPVLLVGLFYGGCGGRVALSMWLKGGGGGVSYSIGKFANSIYLSSLSSSCYTTPVRVSRLGADSIIWQFGWLRPPSLSGTAIIHFLQIDR